MISLILDYSPLYHKGTYLTVYHISTLSYIYLSYSSFNLPVFSLCCYLDTQVSYLLAFKLCWYIDTQVSYLLAFKLCCYLDTQVSYLLAFKLCCYLYTQVSYLLACKLCCYLDTQVSYLLACKLCWYLATVTLFFFPHWHPSLVWSRVITLGMRGVLDCQELCLYSGRMAGSCHKT